MKTINSLRSKLLVLTLALMASVSTFAYDEMPDFQVDGLYYNFLEGDSVQVTFLRTPPVPTEVAADTSNKKNVSGAGYGHLTEIVIPSTVIYEDKTYHVTRIGHGSFLKCVNLQHVDLPTSIKSIGVAAFWSCHSLSSITLNEGLESIEEHALWDCPTLKEVTLPSTLKSLGQKVFGESISLSKVICKAAVPPVVENDLLTGTDNYNASIIPNATLYVPAESLEAYKTAAAWKEFGQILPIEDSFQDLFPTLWGLERTDVEGTTMGYDDPYHMSFSKYTPTLVDGIWYLFDGRNYFREANNQILWYAPYLNIVDAVLYDWTLQVGDTLPIYSNPFHKDNNRGSLFRVTDVSTITLLDGKEYKKWTFSGGFEVVEGIGAINKGFGHYYCLLHTTHPAVYTGWKPICISKNGQLLYQMDEIKMISNELKCMCELTPSYKDQWCNTWNTIDFDGMRFEETAETWQYKLANDTIINNQKYTIVNRYWTADRNNTKQYVAAVRFTDDRKVYIYYDNAEYLLYDFNVQEGDELEVFAGINNYTSEIKTYKCTVTGVEQYACVGCPAAITLEVHNHPNDFREFYRQTQWIEGVGDINGFLNGINHYVEVDGGYTYCLLCAYHDEEQVYTTDNEKLASYNCEYNAGYEYSSPTLAGLQRTMCREYIGYEGRNETWMTETEKEVLINDKFYRKWDKWLLREENDRIYVYSNKQDILLYDFTLEVGDSLRTLILHPDLGIIDVPIGTIYPIDTLIVTNISTVTLLDGKEYRKWSFNNGEFEYVKGIGCLDGNFLALAKDVVNGDYINSHLVCVSKNGKLLYQMDDAEMEQLETECLCEYNAEQKPKDLFPTLWGLQRTGCTKTIGENGNGTTVWGSRSYLMQEIETDTIDGKQYLLFGTNNIYDEYCSLWLREENNKILVYSTAQKKDLVLYDFTLNVGDSLPRLYVDYDLSSVVDYDNDEWGLAPLVVTEVSTITLLDGKEYKKWTFDNGIEYVEGIGSFGSNYGHNDFYQLIVNAPRLSDVYSQHLVCASKNGQLLYQMDEAEMERLGTECLCEVETSYKDQWCNKWNVMWFDGMRFDETARTSQYRLGKDTIIGDYTYSKFTSRTSVRFTDDRKVYVYYEGFDDNDSYTPDLPTGEYLAYDFSAQVGDTLEVFSGIGTYSTYPCVVDDVQIDSETNLRTMTLHKICRIEDDGFFEEYDDMEMTWIEGVGSPEGFLISYRPCGWVGGGTYALLCAYQGDELKYTGSLYKRFGCDYKAGVVSDDLFPTLSGLQRTICREYCEQADNKTRIEQFTNLTTRTETGGPYLYYSPFLLREKDNKILIYSRTLNKDLVLYDFNLQVGDSLPMLYIDFFAKDDWIADRDMEIWCVVDYHKDLEGNILPADTLIVTDVSAITLLDGKEYKKWTFNNGMEYVEGIGSFGNRQWSGDFFQLIANRDVPTSLQGEHLVCVSTNGKLLYQMDDVEMERLGAECLCEVETSYKSQWCDTWNVFVENGSVYPPHEETYRYQLAQDIVIGDYTYTAVVSKAINDALDAPHYVAAVRFTDDRKVYIYYDNTEYLLYDFNVQEGDELEVFAGINNYTSEIKTYKCTVTGIEQYACVGCPAAITLEVHNHPNDFREFYRETQWIEGVGDINGFLNGINHYVEMDGGGSEYLLCAHKGDELKYTGDLYEEYGCGDDAEQSPEDFFPTLWGLQRTHTIEMYDHAPNDGKRSGGYPLPFASVKDTVINGKTYLQFGDYVNGSNYSLFFLREENNKVLIYSSILQNDLVLYDYTLELGDSLPAITSDHDYFSDDHFTKLDKAKDIFTYVVTDVSTVTLLDGIERKKWILKNKYLPIIEYVEGIGCYGENTSHSGDFFRLIYDHPYTTEYVGDHLVCVSKNGQLLYSMPQEEMNSFTLTCECLSQEDTIDPKDLFPTLWGLQRTSLTVKMFPTLFSAKTDVRYIKNKAYLNFRGFFLREENNQVLVYSGLQEEDLVLYDYSLEVGDTLTTLNFDYRIEGVPLTDLVVDYPIPDPYGSYDPIDTLIVTNILYVTLLDGKEYKQWTFNNGMQYVEGIGQFGQSIWAGDFFALIRKPNGFTWPGTRDYLVCASRNGKLLYQMDDAEMERLGAECLCDYNSGPKKDNAKNGKIGGRPTPTQWNQLELDLREMENGNTILRAETFSYTLENDSIVANNKTFYQLARQSTKDTAITKSFVGALHFGEDEDNRVYFLRDGVEYVLYDFTAEPGDSIEIFAGINNYPQETTYTHVVTGKDTLENGACRMMLEVVFPEGIGSDLEQQHLQKIWLAGLGSIDGIVHNAATRATKARSSEIQTSVMLCAWREDNCLYTTNHPEYDTFGCVYNQDPTAVEDVETSGYKYQKIIRDGHLYILRDNKLYDVLGTPMN